MGWVADVAEVFVGTRCAACDNAALGLCAECIVQVRPTPAVVREQPCPVAAAGIYDGVLRSTVIAWKERGRFTLERPLAHLLSASVLALDIVPPIVLVPIPSRPDRRRARGADVVRDLARASARILRRLDCEVHVAAGLILVRRVRDQAGLSAGERAVNLRGALTGRPVRPGSVVLVDDVVTTGATLSEAARAMRTCGRPVAGAAVLAHRPVTGSLRRT